MAKEKSFEKNFIFWNQSPINYKFHLLLLKTILIFFFAIALPKYCLGYTCTCILKSVNYFYAKLRNCRSEFFKHLNIIEINATILLILLFKKQQIYNFTLPYISMPSFIIVRMNFFNSFQLSIIDIYSKTNIFYLFC